MSSSGRGNGRLETNQQGGFRPEADIEELQRDVTDAGFNQSTHHNMRTSEHSFADGSDE